MAGMKNGMGMRLKALVLHSCTIYVQHYNCAMSKNITLKLDESILRKAKHAAVEQDQSLSEWVSNLIVSAFTRQDEFHAARKRALKRMSKGFRLAGKALSREESHAR